MNLTDTEEQIDVLNEDGSKTGEILPKSVVHDRELLHGSVFVWVYNNKGEVLLQLRAKSKKIFPNVWDVSAAGHIAAGESPIEAAIREAEEEIGIKVEASELTQVEFVKDTPTWLPDKIHPELCWIYILEREVDPRGLKLQESELEDVKLESIKNIQLERKNPSASDTFTARNPRIYDTAFAEIERLVS